MKEELVSISAGMPLVGLQMGVDVTSEHEAWLDHVGETFDELLRLRKGKDRTEVNWLVDIVDCGKSANLLKDLVEITKYVPYKGQEVNMTEKAFIWFSVCPDNSYLARFFTH